ncbi:MAG: Holliday junction resolvase RuvX [Rhodospirillaceae bacterium]|jgi:putative holliday junction resolvase|nr:Holliday junction resolvase RuvX [Rhodospirillaceae bacterium]MBT6135901.1 Holliday junction resolvase RuvX [Rhodospirillaceae bacterium]
MPICKPEDLVELRGTGARILGLDLGSKTIGMAVSDASFIVATAVGTIRRRKFTIDVEELRYVVQDRNIGAFILGLPLNMDGTEGPRVQSTRDFATNLLGKIDLPLTFWDERMSTQAVERAMLEEDMTRKRRADRIDTLAATYILQAALDALPRS